MFFLRNSTCVRVWCEFRTRTRAQFHVDMLTTGARAQMHRSESRLPHDHVAAIVVECVRWVYVFCEVCGRSGVVALVDALYVSWEYGSPQPKPTAKPGP